MDDWLFVRAENLALLRAHTRVQKRFLLIFYRGLRQIDIEMQVAYLSLERRSLGCLFLQCFYLLLENPVLTLQSSLLLQQLSQLQHAFFTSEIISPLPRTMLAVPVTIQRMPA